MIIPNTWKVIKFHDSSHHQPVMVILVGMMMIKPLEWLSYGYPMSIP